MNVMIVITVVAFILWQCQVYLSKNKSDKEIINGNSAWDYYEGFEHLLEAFFAFQDKYNDRIVCLFVFPSRKNEGYGAIDILFVFDGEIDLQTTKDNKELFKFFKVVDYDKGESTLKYTYDIFEKYIDYDYTNSRIKDYLKKYMKNHTERVFELTSYGAVIKYW